MADKTRMRPLTWTMRTGMAGLAILAPTVAFAEPIETQSIITALTGDFNGDEAQDLAMIVQTTPGNPHDVYFFLRDKQHNYLKQVAVMRQQVLGEWNGYDRPGYENSDTEPELTALPNRSIELFMPALPIGSARTDQTLIITHRTNSFIVAGFSYQHEDFQQENSQTSCDYNLITGKGESVRTDNDGKEIRTAISVESRLVSVTDWEAGVGFTACGS